MPATATITGSTDINAYGNTTLNPVLNDKNPDQNPVTLNSVKSVEGNTQPTIVGTGIYINTIKTASAIGPYQIAVELKNSKGGIDKIIISGNIVSPDARKIEYPFTQHNDSTFNWVGSGHINNNKLIDASDLATLDKIIAGTYSNSTDLRLMNRADIDLNDTIDVRDRNMLADLLSGKISYLPGDFNKLKTVDERLNLIGKTFDIIKSYKYAYPQTINCTQFGGGFLMDGRGIGPSDMQNFLNSFPYNTKNNGLGCLPVYEVAQIDFAPSDISQTGNSTAHLFNAVLVGDDARVFSNWCFIEPQKTQGVNIKLGQFYFSGKNSMYTIRGTPTKPASGTVGMEEFMAFKVQDNVATYSPIQNWLFNFIYTR